MARPYLHWIVCPLRTRMPPCQAYLSSGMGHVSERDTPESFHMLELSESLVHSQYWARAVARNHLAAPDSDTPFGHMLLELYCDIWEGR